MLTLDQPFQDMIGTCSSITSAVEDDDEDLEKIRQTEDKIYQAHVIRQEISQVEAKISENTL